MGEGYSKNEIPQKIKKYIVSKQTKKDKLKGEQLVILKYSTPVHLEKDMYLSTKCTSKRDLKTVED